ncbi:MAG: ABC transporter substrate-binding protein [Rhizobiales bacterium]|nr:ABC transporter substrate-binding protein [Hyphomicrobiales bacterium]
MELRSILLRSAVLGTVAGAFALGSVSVGQAGEVNVLSANESTCGLYGSHIAEALNVYAEGDLEVNMLSSETTVPYVAFLSTGDAEITMLDTAQVFQMANANQPGAVIYEAMQFAPEGLFVMADSDVKGLRDLKGKVVGLASDRDQITTIVALDSVGISIDEVSTVVVGDSGPVMANALTSGQIAAFAGGGSDRAGIESAGVKTRNITPTAVSQNVGNSWAAWKPRFEDIRGDVTLFLKGYSMGSHAGVMDPKTVGAICRNVLPEEWEVEEQGWALLNNSINVLTMKRTKDHGEPQPDVWNKWGVTFVKLGEIDAEIPASLFLDYSFIAGANAWTTSDLKARLAAWREANADALFD